MAKPNFNIQKRQKELAKKKKQELKHEQKRLLKQAGKNADSAPPAAAEPTEAPKSP